MNCPQENYVYDAAMGELSETELQKLHHHLESCSFCANTYDDLMGTVEEVKAHQPRTASLPLSAKRTLQGKLNFLYEAKKPWYERWLPQSKQAPAFALGLCAALIVGLFLRKSQILNWYVPEPKQQLLVASITRSENTMHTVSVRKVFGEARSKGKKLAPQQIFALGDEIICERDGRLYLDWCGRGQVLVEGASQLQIRADGVALKKGTVHCSVNPTSLGFYVRTANVDVAVVGTRFTVSVDKKGQTKVTVSEGKVAVTNKVTKKTELLSVGDRKVYEITQVSSIGKRESPQEPIDESGTDPALSTAEESEKGSTSDKAVVFEDRTVVEEEKDKNVDKYSKTVEEGF